MDLRVENLCETGEINKKGCTVCTLPNIFVLVFSICIPFGLEPLACSI
jgi:hypothetical protein